MAEVHGGVSRARQMVAIFLVSLAGLLLEVGYTRIVSYKLWYYYTYLVIGLALLGIGSGGIFVVLSKRLRETATQRIIAVCSIFGAISIVIGYLVISRIPVNTLSIWDYGTKASFKNLAIVGRDLPRDLRLVHRARDHRRHDPRARAGRASVASTSPT